jgi:hypothetical protein
MEIDLRQTPTLQLSAPGAAESITAKLHAELKRVDQDEHVVAARTAFEQAESVVERTKRALRVINDRANELTKFLGDIAVTYVDSLIESAAAGGKRPDSKISTQIINAENEHRLSLRAIGRIAEHLIPKSEIAKLRAEADLERIKAHVMDGFTAERGQKLIEAMGAAIEAEGVVTVGANSGVAGMLLDLANAARKAAHGHDKVADEMNEKYQEHQRKQRGF